MNRLNERPWRKGRAVVSFLGAWAIAASLVTAHSASAWDSQVSAVACTPQTSAGSWSVLGGELRNTGSTSLEFYCPFDSSTGRKHYNATYLSVDVHDAGSSFVEANACVRDYDGTTFYCGTSGITGTTGFYSVFPGLGVWTTTYYNWYPYVVVDVPQTTGTPGVHHGLQGVYVSGT